MIDLAIDGSVFVEDRMTEAVQELDMLFNTESTELIGYPEFGTNFQQFAWEMTPSPDDLKSYIEEKITEHTYFLRDLDVTVDVKDYENTYNIEYVINVTVTDNTKANVKTRTYKLGGS